MSRELKILRSLVVKKSLWDKGKRILSLKGESISGWFEKKLLELIEENEEFLRKVESLSPS